MANTKSAKKMGRKIERQTEINRRRRSQVRTMIRWTEHAIEEGDVAAATENLKKVEPQIRRAATKGLFHKKTAWRKISSLTKQLAALSGGSPAAAAAPVAPAPAAAAAATSAEE